MLEDKPASTKMSKRQEQQKILTLCPARETRQRTSSHQESEVKRNDSLMCEICVNPECSPNSYLLSPSGP